MGPSAAWVDAFADRPFSGNPAAVVRLEQPASDRAMQDLAREFGLSETAYLLPEGDDWRLRWFTPSVEVDLCGHATLASAWVLTEMGLAPADAPITFHTRSGPLGARRRGEWVELDFPACPTTPTDAPPNLAEALGAWPLACHVAGEDLMVELASEAELERLAPDFAALATIPVRGVIVTARSAGPADFASRFFGPRVGIPEDPVTGSAHCALAPFWAARLGRTGLTGVQRSARGGTVRVRVEGDRVRLAGRVVTIWQGELAAALESR
ncbi:MAG TPA: PhzF family phenazine biosynthesis protein [Gemmatimonadales bacterium]|nr:PhzF family phenazine biosynthesis protein [Gemmatimonadales bacterium]